MKVLQSTIQVLVLLLTLWSSGAGATEFRDVFDYKTFKELLQKKIGEMPELQSMWTTRKSYPELEKIYIGGGIVRGLIRFLYQELQKTPQVDLWGVEVPSLTELRLPEADRDVFVPENYTQYVLSNHGSWDVLGLDGFMKDSEIVGGITFEKVGINPDSVLDRVNGLISYYEGKFIFTANKKYGHGPFTEGQVVNDYYMALALRFIRIAHGIPGATPTAGSIELLKRLTRQEASHLKEDQYWVKKSLWKLYLEVGGIEKTLLLLKEYELLDILSQAHYAIEKFVNIEELRTALPNLVSKGFTLTDFILFRRMHCKTVDCIKAISTMIVPLAKTSEEYFQILEWDNSNPSDAYRTAIQEIIAETSPAFLHTNATLPEVSKLITLNNNISSSVKLMEGAFARVKTVAEFMTLTHTGSNPSDGYKQAVGALVGQHVEKFATLNPTVKEWRKLMSDRTLYTEYTETALRRAIKQVKNAADYIELTQFLGSSYTKTYKDMVKAVVSETIPVFISLGPTPDEVKKLEARSNSIQDSEKLISGAMEKAKTSSEMVALIASAFKNPTQEYFGVLLKIASQFDSKFLGLSPTKAEITKWESILIKYPDLFVERFLKQIISDSSITTTNAAVNSLRQFRTTNKLNFINRTLIPFFKNLKLKLGPQYNWHALLKEFPDISLRKNIFLMQLNEGTDAKVLWNELVSNANTVEINSYDLAQLSAVMWPYFEKGPRTYEDYLGIYLDVAVDTKIKKKAQEKGLKIAKNKIELEKIGANWAQKSIFQIKDRLGFGPQNCERALTQEIVNDPQKTGAK